MKPKKLLSLCLALVLLLSALPVPAAADEGEAWADEIPAMLAAAPYVEGEVIVAVDAAYADSFDLLAFLGLRESLDGEALMPVPADGVRSGSAVLTAIRDPDRTTEQLLRALAGDKRVAFAEPNYVSASPASVDGGNPQPDAPAGGNGPSRADLAAVDAIPDLTAYQWENRAIHTPGWPDKPEENMPGDPIVVAVMDGAVDFSHPDLAPVAYSFTPEEQALLGCGEHGFSTVTPDGDLLIAEGDAELMHGTHVAGTIGAAWNGHGTSGVASNVKIVSVQVLYDGEGYSSTQIEIVRAFDFIRRANELGADIRITNNSYGSAFVSLVEAAAVRALGEEFGVVSFFGSGNDGEDYRFFPYSKIACRDDPCSVVVAASDEDGALVWFSNFNERCVDLAAPGTGILSAVPSLYANYYPSADDVWYEDFSGDAPKLTADQYGTERDSVEIVSDAPMHGGNALKLTLDKERFKEHGERTTATWVDLTLQDLPEEPFRYLGLRFYTEEDGYLRYYWNFEGSYEVYMPEGGVAMDAWGNTCLDLSADGAYTVDADTGAITVSLHLETPGEIDALWIGAAGLGNALVPYQFKTGTSMSCPVVAGAAAVLAAQTGLKGAELAALVCSKVRHSDALKGLVRTGGVFDFDAEPTAAPKPGKRETVPVYDTAYPLNFSCGDPYVQEEDMRGDLMNNLMTGVGNVLYDLPNQETREFREFSVSRYAFAFDLAGRSWSALPPLPAYLETCTVSMTAHDGKLAVFGRVIHPDDPDVRNDFRVFVYDPGAGKWTAGSSEGVPGANFMNLVDLDGALYLVGGWTRPEGEDYLPGVLQRYDLETGFGETILTLKYQHESTNTQAVAHGGAIWLYDKRDCLLERVTLTGSELMTASESSVKLPDADLNRGILGACSKGIVLFALPNADDTVDTWMLCDGTDEFVPMLRKTTRDRIFDPAGTVYRDRVYVMGFAAEEEDIGFFRSNAVTTLNDPIPAPGDPDDDGYGGDPAPAVPEKADEEKKDDDGKKETAAVTWADVSENAWYASYVAYVTERGLFKGYGDGTFRPEETMDRAMAVQVLWKMAGKPVVDGIIPFGDVSGGDWYCEAVRWAYSAGITNGTGALFEPTAPVTREQFATMLYRFLKLSGKGFTGTWAFRLDFPDASSVSDWAQEAMSWLVMNGIIEGMDGMLNPQGVLTRAQTAALLQRVAEILEG